MPVVSIVAHVKYGVSAYRFRVRVRVRSRVSLKVSLRVLV